METSQPKIKVGSFTLALGLIALGLGILSSNLGYTDIRQVLKFWPLLLVGLGLEYFVRRAMAGGEREIQFSIPSAVLIALIAVLALFASAVYKLAPYDLLGEIFNVNGSEYVRDWQGDPIAAAEGSRLEVDVKSGSIEITPSPDDKIHVSAKITGRGSTPENAKAAAENQKIQVEAGQLIKIYTLPENVPGGKNTSVKMQLEIPSGLEVTASTNLGNILAQKTSAKKLSLETASGRIEVEDQSGDVRAVSRLGEINLSSVAGDAVAESSEGRITILNPGGNVTATCCNGSIELASSSPLVKKYELRGTNGGITFRLPKNSSLKIQARNNNSNISGLEKYSGGPGEFTGEATLGDSKGSAFLETNNGDIRVNII
ncbi:MAG: DUF4097 family beta strand repeat-containing protein [Bacillota bacterium]